ncbi:MAG: dienelactone hydrolase [Proteobacteria bacterium]|nr:dienelactone hydrolase [Pseudomonadota bacterium]
MRSAAALGFAALLALPSLPRAAEPPSRFGVDAPELAPPGSLAVGVKTLRLVQPDQPLVPAAGAAGPIERRDRVLQVDVWYPAVAEKAGRSQRSRARFANGGITAARDATAPGIVYEASLPSEPPAPPAHFTIPGIARRDAPALAGVYPLIIVSHGYSNATVAMSWLTENLASKGYVVAAIRHEDPPITDRSQFSSVLLRRPLDIAFVSGELQGPLAAQLHLDAQRTALVGYSMGGYGVLTAGGAELDPEGGVGKIPGGLGLPYVRGGAGQDQVRVRNLRAVVALAPAGAASHAWDAQGLRALRAPLLLIAGDEDRTVDYRSGALALFEQAVNAPRYLLTFKHAGHAIGLDPVPEAMRGKLWDLDWFEDPVWRKERITAIEVHFITAFLDRQVKGEESRAAYLEVAAEDSDAGQWPAARVAGYADFSPGNGEISVWKGFQRNHAAGLSLRHAAPASIP